MKGHLRLICNRMQLGELDVSGRRRPVPIKGSEFSMDFASIIAAIGQAPDIPGEFGLDEKLAVEEARRCFQCGVRLQIPPAPLPPVRVKDKPEMVKTVV